MKKAFFLFYALPAALMLFTSCSAQQTKQEAALTKQIVEHTIQQKLYPPFDTDVVKTTLEFHSVRIAKPTTASQLHDYYFPDTTILYPVQAKFTVTHRSQLSPNQPAKYDIHDITQTYTFYQDAFGNWELKISSTGEDSDVERRK